jgi:hypothetical protein
MIKYLSAHFMTLQVYIGFPKGDYAPRTGRKGRMIVDDPKRQEGSELLADKMCEQYFESAEHAAGILEKMTWVP